MPGSTSRCAPTAGSWPGVSLSDEYWLAHTELGFTREEIDRLILNGFESAFLPWPERQELLERVRTSWRRCSHESRVALSSL